jgi:hypothetical protein
MMRLDARLFSLALIAALCACGRSDKESDAPDADVANGDDPLRALAAPVQSTRYTSAYWQTRAGQDPALWQKAVTYCDAQRSAAQGTKPNCGAVFNAQFEIAGRAPVQKYPRKSAAEMEQRP